MKNFNRKKDKLRKERQADQKAGINTDYNSVFIANYSKPFTGKKLKKLKKYARQKLKGK